MPLLKRFFGNAKHTTSSRKKEDLFKIGYLFLCFFSFIIFYIINRALHYSSNSQPQDLVPFDIISIVILAITSMAMLIIGLKMRRINIPKQNMISYLYKLDIVKVLIYVIIAVTAMENQVQIHYSTEQETFSSMEWLALELVTLAWLTILSLYAKLANIFVVIFNFVYLFVRLEGYNDATLGAAFFLVKIVPITFFLYRFKTVDENLQETKIKKKEEGKVATRVLNLLPEGVAIVDHDGLQYINNSMRAIMKVDDQQVLSILYSLENRQFVGVVQAPGTVRKSISAMPYDIYKNSSDLFDGDSAKLSTFSKASQIDLRKLAKLSKEKPVAGSAGSMSPAKGGFTPKWKNPLENSNTPKNAPPKKKLSKLNTNGSIMLSFTPRNSPIASNIRLPAGFGEDGTKTKDEREIGTTIINNDASPSIRIERRGDTAMSSAIANITMMQRRIKRILNKIGGDPYRTSPHRNVREAIVDILGKMREEFVADAQNENQNGMKDENLKTKFKYASRSLTFNSIPKKGESVGPSYWAVAMHSIRKTSEDRLQYLEIKFTPIISEGKPALILLVRDVTEKEIIKEMEEKERNQSAALASVSHEFRTPLHGIMGMLEHLKEHITNKVNQSYLVPAYNSAKLLMTLVNDILDFHQIKEKKLVLVPVKFNLRDKLEESLSLILLQAKARKLELKIDISPETPRIICNDPNRMQQIVNNLLGNAIKFTLEGSITIKVEAYQGNKIAIKVVDTGIGIEPQNIEKLFKAFGKIDSKRNRELNPQGVGLGLTISNNLAKVLCSDPKVSGLNVTSEHLKGSTFWFVIDNIQAMNRLYDVEDDDDDFKPLNENLEELNKKYSSKDAAVSIQMTSSLPMLKETLNTKVDSPSMICDTLITESAVLIKRDQSPEIYSEDEKGRMRRNVLRRTFVMNDNFSRILEGLKQTTQETPAILIVDDTEINHMILKNFLELFSLEVDSAYNGKQALEKIKERNTQGKPYIFVLLDVEMPIMDGLECARILKKLMSEGEISSIPVIAQSGHSEEEEIQKCKNAGMTDYLVKPVTKKKLIETLVKWLPKENS